MNRTLKLGALLALIVALVVIFPIGDWIEAGAGWAQGQGTTGLLVFAALYAVATVFAVPGSALTLIAGGAFGFAPGTAAVWVGATIGLALAFLVARRLARERVTTWLATKPSFAAVDRAVAAEGWKIVFLTRLTPVFPVHRPELRLRAHRGLIRGLSRGLGDRNPPGNAALHLPRQQRGARRFRRIGPARSRIADRRAGRVRPGHDPHHPDRPQGAPRGRRRIRRTVRATPRE